MNKAILRPAKERFWWWMGLYSFGVFFFCVVMTSPNLWWAPGIEPLVFPDFWNAVRRSFSFFNENARFSLFLSFIFLWIAYFGVLRFLNRFGSAISLRVLIVATAVLGILFLLQPNFLSSDIYDNIGHGRVAIIHHANPMTTPMSEFQDPLTKHAYWKTVPCVYGPVWVNIAIVITFFVELMGSGLLLYLMAHKLVALLFHLGTGWILWKFWDSFTPNKRMLWAGAYLLNPLAMVEFAGNGHNDSLMIFLLCLGFLMDKRNRLKTAVAFFTMAALTKIYTLPVIFFYFARKWREIPDGKDRLVPVATFTNVFLIVAILFFLPYWQGASILTTPLQGPASRWLTNSVADFFFRLTLKIIPEAPIDSLRVWFRTIPLIVTLAYCLGTVFRKDFQSRYYEWISLYFFLWCAFGAVWFHAWYAIVCLAVAACSERESHLKAGVLFTLLAPLVYLIGGPSILPPTHPDSVLPWHSVLIFPPIWIFLIVSFRNSPPLKPTR